MLNEMIKKIMAAILATMMAFTTTGDVAKNEGKVDDVVDTTVSATETSDIETETESDYIVIVPENGEGENLVVTPEKENDNGATTPSDEDVVVETHPSEDKEEHKTTVTYNPTEEDIKNKEESKKEEEKVETPKVEETKPAEKEPVVEEKKEEAKPAVTFTDVNETVYATSGVNIRKGPSTDYEKVGSLNKNDAVTRIGIGSNGWSKIKYNGTVAYVSGNYLTTTKPVVETPKVDETKPAQPAPEAPKKTAYDTDTVSMVNKLFGNGSVSGAYADYERQVLEAINTGNGNYITTANFGDKGFKAFVEEFKNAHGYEVVYSGKGVGPEKHYIVDGVSTAKNKAKFDTEMGYIVNAVNSCGIYKGMPVKDACLKINNYICNLITYEGGQIDPIVAFSTGKGNCAAYASLFRMMCQYCGINAYCEGGWGKNDAHGWNYVVFSNNEKCMVDVCWNDSTGNKYFMMSTSEFYKDHTPQ